MNEVKDLLFKSHVHTVKNRKTEQKYTLPIVKYLKRNKYHPPINNRVDLCKLVYIISGQSNLHASKFKRERFKFSAIIPNCHKCGAKEENTHHFMAGCPAYDEIRHKVFGESKITFEQITAQHSPETILRYIKETGRLEETYQIFEILD